MITCLAEEGRWEGGVGKLEEEREGRVELIREERVAKKNRTCTETGSGSLSSRVRVKASWTCI